MAPWKFPWISDCIEGSSSEGPRPPMTAQKTTIGHRLWDKVIDSTPAAYPSNPSTYARLRPIRSPILLPMRMNAAETSASSAIADCTPLAVVSRSCTTAEIETFISDVSTTSTNIAIARRTASSVSPLGSSGTAVAASAVTSPDVVRHLVDADRDREDQRVVLAGLDLDAVGVPHAEPLLRHLRHLVAAALDLVLVVDDVALRLHVLAVLDVDREAVTQRGDERLLHGRHLLVAALDRHLVAHGQLLLLDLEELLATGRLEDERVADAKRLAVHLEDAVAAVGLDPVVVADREHLLAHLVLRPAIVVAA